MFLIKEDLTIETILMQKREIVDMQNVDLMHLFSTLKLSNAKTLKYTQAPFELIQESIN